MAVPKKKVSPGRKKIRRQFYALKPVAATACPQCFELKRSHRVCSCGFYDGRKVYTPRSEGRNQVSAAESK